VLKTLSLIASLSAFTSVFGADNTVRLNPPLQKYVEARTAEFDLIPPERKEQLTQIAGYVCSRTKSSQTAKLTFICTHNSRRSHLAQIWAQTAAIHFGVPGVQTFSGGTEATAFNPRAIEALRRAGFDTPIHQPPLPGNPRYQMRYHPNAPPLECFSKVYNEDPNPKRDFCALLTCSQADQACPIVEGASLRIALPYDDPKAFDDTPDEALKYDERSQQIAREMLYVLFKATELLR
jgi:hypothetical protein